MSFRQITKEETTEFNSADISQHVRVGYLILITLVAVVGIWGGTAKISGAVLAPAKLVLERSVKRVQHKEGGIVTELLVKEGDQVVAGQVLARIDPTVPRANLAVVEKQLTELAAKRLRMLAERDSLTDFPAYSDISSFKSQTQQLILASERKLMRDRRELERRKKERLSQQIRQLDEQIVGLESQIASKVKQGSLIEQEAKGVRRLYEQGLVTLTQLSSLEREAHKLEGDKAELVATIAETRAKISEVETQLLQIDSERITDAALELSEIDSKLAQLVEQKIKSDDELRRVELRAPDEGRIQQLKIHTVGGVVGSGEVLMTVVPDRDELIVEAMIEPQSIDQVAPKQQAHIRFTAFSAAKTPTLDATIESVTTDVVVDEHTQDQYYLARLRIEGSKLPAEIRRNLTAGMPAEVHIATSERTAISYFLKPITDQLARAFNEE